MVTSSLVASQEARAELSTYPKNVTDTYLCVGVSGIGMPPVRFFG